MAGSKLAGFAAEMAVGAVILFENVNRDLEDTQVLATDGSSAELLHAALAQLIAVW
jgi:hypothetical protein